MTTLIKTGLPLLPHHLLHSGCDTVHLNGHLHLGGMVLQERLIPILVAHQGGADRGQCVCEHILHRLPQHISDSPSV